VHKLFARQLAKATKPTGEVDTDVLGKLVIEAYAQADRDRRRTDRSIGLMIEELDQLNRGLEQQVEERTATLRERENELQAQNTRFDVALRHMSQALLMFDGSYRLVICNQRYIEMYGLSTEVVQPGCTFHELL
jgi:PAS domain-containing protein